MFVWCVRAQGSQYVLAVGSKPWISLATFFSCRSLRRSPNGKIKSQNTTPRMRRVLIQPRTSPTFIHGRYTTLIDPGATSAQSDSVVASTHGHHGNGRSRNNGKRRPNKTTAMAAVVKPNFRRPFASNSGMSCIESPSRVQIRTSTPRLAFELVDPALQAESSRLPGNPFLYA